MRWATRAGCHVDRAACAWLIRRFTDPDAVYVFVDDPDQVPADATPFDLSMVLDDTAMLTVTGPLFDGLYEYRRRALLLGREPS